MFLAPTDFRPTFRTPPSDIGPDMTSAHNRYDDVVDDDDGMSSLSGGDGLEYYDEEENVKRPGQLCSFIISSCYLTSSTTIF